MSNTNSGLLQIYLLVCLTLVIVRSQDSSTHSGLYVTNSTHIIYSDTGLPGHETVIFSQVTGRIVGLAVDLRKGFIFWSDISHTKRGIYRAQLRGNQPLEDATNIIQTDVIEVNGLAVDWVSQHIYWTDAYRRTIELADYDGKNRRILDLPGLLLPRGIVIDPIVGYIFWGDQGSRKIERCRLDGTERETLVADQVYWPNQLALHENKLYWVDAWTKSLMQKEYNKKEVVSIKNLGGYSQNDPIYGVALRADTAFVSVWNKGLIVAVDTETLSSDVRFEKMGTDAVFSLIYVDSNHQRKGGNPCGQPSKGACSHLCLPIDGTTYRCSCPSFGGLSLKKDGKTCGEPENVLFYALGDVGQVGFLAVDGAQTGDRYLVGRSLRPVAVGYDPIDQMVYWSDVHERSVHRAKMDGSEQQIFLNYNHSLGVVDGLAVDWQNRRLYYGHMGHVVTAGAAFTWHKIEMINLDGTDRRTVDTMAEKPRGLWLDPGKGHLYYTDWGMEAGVWRTNLDGSDSETIQRNLDNPNGVVMMKDDVYVIDSHAKTRDTNTPNYPRSPRNGTLNTLQQGEWKVVEGVNLMTPFALTASADRLYISDWDLGSIVSVSMATEGSPQVESIITGVTRPMGLFYSPRTATLSPDAGDQCKNAGCEEICVWDPTDSAATCTCPTYDADVLTIDGKTCQIPDDFLLVADMNSIKMVSLDGADWSVYVIVQGSSYFSNFAAMVYNPEDKAIYFSDVNRRVIYYSKLDGSQTKIFYKTNHIIDGMVLDSKHQKLYWTDYLSGIIATVGLSGDEKTYNEIVKNLSQPRALALDQQTDMLYWTEWGSKPRVGRVNLLNTTDVITLVSEDLLKPNGIYLDLAAGKLYIGDAEHKAVYEGYINGTRLRKLPYVSDRPGHIFDIQIKGDWLIYSDWVSHTISAVSTQTGQEIELVSDLMRPTLFHIETKNIVCPAGHGCEERCLPYPGGYVCTCQPGRRLNADQKTCTGGGWSEVPSMRCSEDCTAKPSTSCAQKDSTVIFGCQCVAGYTPADNLCVACSSGEFKPDVGPDACEECPTHSVSPGSTQCQCPGGLVWNWKTFTCEGDKPGQCPRYTIPSMVDCKSPCTSDADCHGARRCCLGPSKCDDIKQCLDPVGLSDCIYNGTVYRIGDSFKPSGCVTCTCEMDKSVGHLGYGKAECRYQSCGSLPCTEEYQATPEDQCCPVCLPENINKPIEIINCPKGVIHKRLPPDQAYVSYDPELTMRDNLKLRRDIRVTREPDATRFWWKGSTPSSYQKVTVTASARAPDGAINTDVCSYAVNVIDGIAPVIKCPVNIHVYTRTDSASITWPPSTAVDNVATVGPPTLESLDLAPDNTFTLGTHRAIYSTKDRAGNEARCSSYAYVEKLDISCSVPPTVTFGELNCGKHNVSDYLLSTCFLTCAPGYTPNKDYGVEYSYRCQDNAWVPPFPAHFSTRACVRLRSERWWSRGRLDFAASGGASTEADVEVGFKTALLRRYLQPYNLEFLVHVEVLHMENAKVTRKKRDDARFALSFVLEGPDNFTSALILDDFELLQQEMSRDVNESRFHIEGNGETLTARPNSFRYEPIIKGCSDGEQLTSNGCLVCPVGSHKSVASGMCETCPANTFQGMEGQSLCEKCPEDKQTLPGSYSLQQCVSSAGQTTPARSVPLDVVVGACVGAGTFILCIIIIVAIIVFLRKHLSSKSKLETTSDLRRMEFSNQAYSEEDHYNEMPADKLPEENGKQNRNGAPMTMSF